MTPSLWSDMQMMFEHKAEKKSLDASLQQTACYCRKDINSRHLALMVSVFAGPGTDARRMSNGWL